MRFYIKFKVLTCYIILVGMLTLIGCVGSPSAVEEDHEPFNGVPLNNRLTLEGQTLLIPEDWSFVQNLSENGTLFNFKSSEEIEGGLEYISFDYEIDSKKLVDFYKDYVFKSEKRIVVDSIEHDKFGTITSFSGYAKDRFLYSLLLTKGNNATFLHFNSSKDSPILISEAFAILDTYSSDSRIGFSVRAKKGTPLFFSTDNSWFWFNDFKDGYFISLNAEVGIEDSIIGLWTTTDEEIDEYKSNNYLEIEPFKLNYIVQNVITEFEIYGTKAFSGDSTFFAIFEYKSKTYCLNLIGKSIKKDVDPIEHFKSYDIQKLFDFHIQFIEVE